MAEEDDTEKTEDPTARRIDEALQRGDVVKSNEVNTWFMLGAGTLVLYGFSDQVGSALMQTCRGLIANSYAIPMDGTALIRLMSRIGFEVATAVAIPVVLFMLAAVCGNMVQHRFVWSFSTIRPRLSKLSLMGGLKRLFSRQGLLNVAKGLFKLVLVGGVLFVLMWPERTHMSALVSFDPAALAVYMQARVVKLFAAVVAIMAVLAAGDYLLQYRDWFEKHKMSVREVKEEFKSSEGDPKVKGRIRQLRMTKARKRMMAAVPTATVVITNPTHFAVALRYERGMNAPVCVAKGVDAVALRIREMAADHRVPIVENPPLARVLHAAVEIDQEVPAEHYKAVAEVIGYVLRAARAWRQ